MKNMYKCECCGKLFTDWDECYTHEQMHRDDLEPIYNWDLPVNEIDRGNLPDVRSWGENDTAPNCIFMKMTHKDDNGKIVRNKYGDVVYDVFKYVRVRDRDARVECANLVDAMYTRSIEDHADDEPCAESEEQTDSQPTEQTNEEE